MIKLLSGHTVNSYWASRQGGILSAWGEPAFFLLQSCFTLLPCIATLNPLWPTEIRKALTTPNWRNCRVGKQQLSVSFPCHLLTPGDLWPQALTQWTGDTWEMLFVLVGTTVARCDEIHCVWVLMYGSWAQPFTKANGKQRLAYPPLQQSQCVQHVCSTATQHPWKALRNGSVRQSCVLCAAN